MDTHFQAQTGFHLPLLYHMYHYNVLYIVLALISFGEPYMYIYLNTPIGTQPSTKYWGGGLRPSLWHPREGLTTSCSHKINEDVWLILQAITTCMYAVSYAQQALDDDRMTTQHWPGSDHILKAYRFFFMFWFFNKRIRYKQKQR